MYLNSVNSILDAEKSPTFEVSTATPRGWYLNDTSFMTSAN